MGITVDKNFDFYVKADLTKYEGKWIAIVDQKIVAASDSVKEVFAKVKKDFPGKRPLFDHVTKAGHHFLK